MGRGTSPSRGMEGDALSSAIFRLHEQLIPLSYLSSISGIINHFDDLHFTSPFTNILTLWVRGGKCCAVVLQNREERQIAVLFNVVGARRRAGGPAQMEMVVEKWVHQFPIHFHSIPYSTQFTTKMFCLHMYMAQLLV